MRVNRGTVIIMDPYRLSENESIIIDTRISALEEQTKSVVTWRRLAIALSIVTSLVCVYACYTDRAPCRDEVVLLSNGILSSNSKASCSHAKHTGTVSNSNGHTMIYCACR